MHGSANSPTAVHILGESTDVMSIESQEHLDFRVGVRFHGTRHKATDEGKDQGIVHMFHSVSRGAVNIEFKRMAVLRTLW